ncbi:hypothetical protein [Prosthecobacter sp.]|uniref:hypothetical protein n=1 Tax=Prosthecobacter sp. TaxID=1965333 RepID=UPI003782F1ED
MKIVGDYIAAEAFSRQDPAEFDLFCRSAFNRYYYAAFLAIRNVLKTLDSSWATPAHQAIPGILRSAVLRRLRTEIQKATSTALITHSEGTRLISAASSAASELANLLVAARETRRLADYEPETKVIKKGPQTQLGNFTLEAASKWENRVTIQSKTILRVYGELGLI